MARRLITCDHCHHVHKLMWQMSIVQWFVVLVFTGVIGLLINKIGALMEIRFR